MPNLADINSCTECSACYNICPHQAITMGTDGKGFHTPIVDSKKCVECRMCERVCPIVSPKVRTTDFKTIVYAGWHKDRGLRMSSSSGGAFSALAETIIKEGGVVYGAAWHDSRSVRHIRVATIDDLGKLRKSKYIPSEIGKIYIQVRKDLKDGLKVLFSGTPCQIIGLKNFLNHKYFDNLTTVDFICHGVPSPTVFTAYIDYLEGRYGDKVEYVDFRDKSLGVESNLLFQSRLNTGKIKKEMFDGNSFYRGFIDNLYLRPSCYQCTFNTPARTADISLADFRGLGSRGNFDRLRERRFGFTGMMINSEKGARLVESAENLCVIQRAEEELYNSQPHLLHPAKRNKDSQEFWSKFDKIPYEDLAKRFMPMSFRNRVLNIVRYILRPRLYYFLGESSKRLLRR